MPEPLLGPWLRRFLVEYLVTDRNLASNTQSSYRDTWVLLLPFLAGQVRQAPDRLQVTDLTPERLRQFLKHLEHDRQCSAITCNQRLAAIRSFAGFVAAHSPEHVDWCGQVRAVPVKKAASSPVQYLELDEAQAVLAAPDPATLRGRRERLLLQFLYNTGARASEAARLQVGDLRPGAGSGDRLVVRLRGKGGKERLCPLWQSTSQELSVSVRGRADTEAVFLNRCGKPLTRYGIYELVARCAKTAAHALPSMADKRVSPHTIRHTTATHLLRSGVDINTIRAWLGHATLQTTNIYAEVDLRAKARAIDQCKIETDREPEHWKDRPDLMAFLKGL